MAEAFRFVCCECSKSITAWSDGNPYYLDEEGDKQYAYHPNHELLELCIGNDKPHLCLMCGEEFKVDSRAPVSHCLACSSSSICDTFHLEGESCPYCKKGYFRADPNFFIIS